MRLEGTYTAIVTPFLDTPGQPVDWDALDALVDAQIAGGITGLVPCGTTGESPTLSNAEHIKVIERTIARAKGKALVVAGAGSNSTREAVEMAQHAERAGADAVMIVVPYYNRPTQDGLATHFVTVARSVKLPVVVYNIPARTGSDLLPETLARIAEAAPNVVCTKEATGNVLRAQKIVQTMASRMTVLSGDDALTLPMMAVGARGVISVTSNVLPAEVSRVTRLALEGSWDEARRAHLALLPVHEAMFVEANPSPAKAALAMRGVMKDVVRGPLAPCSEGARKVVAAALEAYGATAKGSR
jgi:4-hydroxy-tetrahydrodipicolinate synthase